MVCLKNKNKKQLLLCSYCRHISFHFFREYESLVAILHSILLFLENSQEKSETAGMTSLCDLLVPMELRHNNDMMDYAYH